MEITKHPGIKERMEASLIDGIIIIIILISTAKLLVHFPSIDESSRILIFALFLFCFDPLLTSTFGCTIGQFVKGIRVRQFKNENANILFPLALVRFILKIVLGSISYFTIPRSKNYRALHDYCSGSIVIYK